MSSMQKNSSKQATEKSKEIKGKKKMVKHKTIPDKTLTIPILDKKHTPTHNNNNYIINNNLKNIEIHNTNESHYLPYKKDSPYRS